MTSPGATLALPDALARIFSVIVNPIFSYLQYSLPIQFHFKGKEELMHRTGLSKGGSLNRSCFDPATAGHERHI
jgi:hypothetical protein